MLNRHDAIGSNGKTFGLFPGYGHSNLNLTPSPKRIN